MQRYKHHLPLVAILRGITPDEVLAHAEILVEQGFTMIEVPTNSPEWQKSIQLLQQRFNHSLLIGAGTVVKSEHLTDLIELQGTLMVTPNTNPALIQRAKTHNMLTCIGALTPSEMFSAIEAGADIIKIFPGHCLGLNYIRAIKAVLPAELPLYAVGGVTPDNLADFIQVGCQGAGLGSDLYRAGQSTTQTELKAKRYIQAWHEVANENHSTTSL